MKKQYLNSTFVTIGVFLFAVFTPVKISRYNSPNISGASNMYLIDQKSVRSRIYQKVLRIRKANNKVIPCSKRSNKKLSEAMRHFGTIRYEYLLRESLLFNPNNVTALGRLSEHLLGLGKKEESRDLAVQCIAISPQNRVCHRSIISSFEKYKDFQEPFYYFKDCIEDDPKNIYCNSSLYNYYLANHKEYEAQKYLTRMIAEESESVLAIINQADRAYSKGHFYKALSLYTDACQKENLYACKRKKQLHAKVFRDKEP